MSDVTIRPARPEEGEVLTRLVLAAKRHWGYSEDLISLWEKDLTITAEFISANSVFVADVDGRPRGVFAVRFEEPSAELEHLWVEPGHMEKGLGRDLMLRAIEVARSGGVRSLIIVSDPHAEDFYRRMGAKRVGAVASLPEGRTLPKLVLDLEKDDPERS
jgi:GNAT superfamily N-acetyltransferase